MKTRVIRWMCGCMRLDKIKNEVIRGKVGMKSIKDKMREARLRWFGHIRQMSMTTTMRRHEMIVLSKCK